MKKRIISLLLILVGFTGSACADYDVEVLKANLKQHSNQMKSFSGIDYDYVHINNTEEASKEIEKKEKIKDPQIDALICVNKNGKISHEVTLVHPEDAEFTALFEGEEQILLIYHQEKGSQDIIFVNRIDKRDVAPKWNPEILMLVKAKKRDYLQYDISPDKSHFVVGEASRKSKKDNYMLHITTLDRTGKIVYSQISYLQYIYKKVYFLDVVVNNDGITYCSLFNYDTKSKYSNVHVYALNGKDCKAYSENIGVSWYFDYPFCSATTTSGGFVLGGVSSEKQSVLFYLPSPDASLQKKVDSFSDYAKSAVESSFGKMHESSSPVSDGKWMETHGLYQLSDGSYVVISETWGKAHRETQKKTTTSYQDKNGKTHTTTTYTTERDNYVHWSGDIVAAFYDKDLNLIGYKVCNKFQKRYTGGFSSRYDNGMFRKQSYSILNCLSHKSFVDGDELKLLYYINDGQEYWNVCTMKHDKNIVNKVVEYSKCDFEIRDVNFAYKDYWVVHLYGEKKKRLNDLSILLLHAKDTESEQTDVTEESPDLF